MKELNKILSGKIIVKLRDQLIIVNQPDAQTRYLADSFAEQVYKEAFAEDLYLQEELEDLIVQNGWWTEEQETALTEIPKRLEVMKVDYFNNFFKTEQRDKTKRAIKRTESVFEDLQRIKYGLFNYTCESLQTQAYTMFIIQECVTDQHGNKLDKDLFNPHVIYSKYNDELLGDKEIRNVSKSSEWRLIWNATKSGNTLFSFPACDFTDMQKGLINWSRVYDSIYESPDMPSDEIIEDDYAIDGWFTSQKNKRDDDKKESMQDTLPKTGEVFVMVKNKEEAKNVYNMNTQEGKANIKSREKDLKERGSLEEYEFSHVQTKLKMQANQLLSEHYKKKG
jgi:hypothetical protein